MWGGGLEISELDSGKPGSGWDCPPTRETVQKVKSKRSLISLWAAHRGEGGAGKEAGGGRAGQGRGELGARGRELRGEPVAGS